MRDKVRLALAAVVAAAVSCELALPAAGAQSAKRDPDISPEARALVRHAVAATGLVLVRNSGDSAAPRARGSAVLVRSDGIVATNQHVITSDKTNRLYDEIIFSLSRDGEPGSDGTRYRLKPLLISKEYDLALLGVEADAAGNPLPKSFTFPAVEIGDSRRIRILEDLFIIGFPEKGGSTVTVSRGVVEGKDILANWIKTDARMIHGNSGGAAVNGEGKLIGIPTKVVADEQPVDKNGDGFPDGYRRYGAVGFLRPSHLIVEMLARIGSDGAKRELLPPAPPAAAGNRLITVRGVVRSPAGYPITGALVGLLPAGETNVTESTLLTWGSTNSDGEFKLNRPVPPGRYTLKAKAFASQSYTLDVDIGPSTPPLIIEMRASSRQ